MLALIAETDFAGHQSRGARATQEDVYAFSEIAGTRGQDEGLLAVVADGMGGHSAGERASALAVKTFIDAFQQTHGPLAERMAAGLRGANDSIKNELKREPALAGMGTTLLAVCLTLAGLEWISVGDSPLYLLRGSTLKRLNEDHSLRPILKEMAERGQLPASSSAQSVSGSILRAALMGEEIELTDQSPEPLPISEEDLVILATDGIHTLNDRDIIATCADSRGLDASVLGEGLIRAVNNAGHPKQDNVTVALLKPRSH
jgi:protein phosphatase